MLSLFMLHCPQDGQRGRRFAGDFAFGGLRLLVLGTAHPFFGRLTFGTNQEKGPDSIN
jgi:hypothetical protein